MEKQRFFTRHLFCWILSVVLVLSMVPAVFASEALFDISGSTMTLGNTLEINFVIDTANLAGSDNYAEI
ncbi:MAG: hypothetical protein IJO45_03700, partial [Oscillospiraceae bacterium]|nr:hypothetical protein [Oscillospiraceae bacterium]